MPSQFTEQQNQAIRAHRHDICVAAGAGSGKTGVLVERFVRIVTESRSGILPEAERAAVDQILVITFTDKATREMKSRIVGALDTLRLVDERRQIETAYISTIHGFCSRLLQENPFEAGVDPRFRVLDEPQSRRLLRHTFELVVERAYADGDEEIIELISAAQNARVWNSATGDPLVALATSVEGVLSRLRGAGRTLEELELHWQRGLESTAEASLGPVWAVLAPITQEVVGCAETLRALRLNVPPALRRSRDAVLAAAEQLHQDDQSLDTARAALREVREALAKNRPHAGMGEHENDIVRSLLGLRETLEAAQLLFTAAAGREEEAAVHCHRMMALLIAVWKAYTAAKTKDGTLDNDDLQEQAVLLLESAPGVRRRYRTRFRHIMVDEFQDTNALQMRLIDILHRTAKSENPNYMFVVGDVQQSIYAFRNADPGIFRDVERRYRAEGAGMHVQLAANFRSRPEILHAIGTVFGQVWRDAPTPFVRLSSAAEYTEKSGPSVEIMIADQMGRRDYVPLEAAALAGRVRTLVEGAEVTITARSHARFGQPAGYRDVAILLRSLADIQKYEEAFARAGVPTFVMGGGRGYYARHEIRDILNVLTMLETPLDDIAVAAVLRSPFVGIHTDTLFRLVRIARARLSEEIGGAQRGQAPLFPAIRLLAQSNEIPAEEAERLSSFLQIIGALAGEEDRLPVGRLLERLIAASHYDARLLCRPGGRRRLANVRKLLQMANSEPVMGVRDFILRLRDMERLSDREGDAPTEEEEADVVRFVTIHGAKGLEFPVVIVGDLGRGLTFKEDSLFVCSPHSLAFGTRLGGEPNVVYTAIDRAHVKADEDESARLLYVAVTRAREHLILCGNYGRKGTFNWAEQVFGILGVSEPPAEPEQRDLVGGIRALVAPLNAYTGIYNDPRLGGGTADLIDEAIRRMSARAGPAA